MFYNSKEFKMPNYRLGKIYSVRSLTRPDLIYVGSTCVPLTVRMGQHRTPSNKCSSKRVVEIGDAYIELIENFPCNDIYELKARENRHMRAIDCVNKNSAMADCPHGRVQSHCIDCHGTQICIHQIRKQLCIECGGSLVCIHKTQRIACKTCNPIQCDFCNIIHSKSSYPRHIRTSKHKKNYIAEFLRVFEMTITEAEVPEI